MTGTDGWVSTPEIARLLGVSESTVYRSLADPETADREWGAGNWRRKPLLRRAVFQVKRSIVLAKAGPQT
jgi:transposase